MRTAMLTLLLLIGGFGGWDAKAFTDPAPLPKAPSIKFQDVTPPAPKVDPAPSPTPLPKPVDDPAVLPKLTPDVVYTALQSDAPFLIRASPANLVKITKMSGPFVFRGKFSDGNGSYETRQFTAKYVAFVEPLGVGKVELIATPVGAVDEKDDVRKLLDVDDGTKPQPPPKPPTPEPAPAPKPNPPPVPPDPKPAPIGAGEFVVVIRDDATMTPSAAKLYDCATLQAYKNAGKCRIFGNVVDATKIQTLKYDKMMSQEGVSAPCVLVVTQTGHPVASFALPGTETALAAKLKEVMAP